MSFGLLPLEKIPLFVWGLLLAAIGGFLAFVESPFTWPQARGLALLAIGVVVTAYGLRKRSRAGSGADSSGGTNG
jgi:uncharacterized membrane protein YccC